MTNSDTPKNYPQDDRNFQNPNTHPQSSDKDSNRYDSENLDQESGSDSKDITEQDIEKDLIENDPSEGFETDLDTKKDNPVNKEFEIGHLGNEELKEDELNRDESRHGGYNNKPSQRKF